MQITDEDIVLVEDCFFLKLPNSCTPGRFEAVETFAAFTKELRGRFPKKKFQFIPFSYKTLLDGTTLVSILAIPS